MVHKPVRVKSSATILEAIDLIIEHRVSGLCVIDDDDQLVGMLSELDCLQALVEKVYDGGADTPGLVSEVMTADVMINKPTDDIISVATSMLDTKHRRRPVVHGKRLVGQVTCRQILGAIRSFTVPEK